MRKLKRKVVHEDSLDRWNEQVKLLLMHCRHRSVHDMKRKNPVMIRFRINYTLYIILKLCLFQFSYLLSRKRQLWFVVVRSVRTAAHNDDWLVRKGQDDTGMSLSQLKRLSQLVHSRNNWFYRSCGSLVELISDESLFVVDVVVGSQQLKRMRGIWGKTPNIQLSMTITSLAGASGQIQTRV